MPVFFSCLSAAECVSSSTVVLGTLLAALYELVCKLNEGLTSTYSPVAQIKLNRIREIGYFGTFLCIVSTLEQRWNRKLKVAVRRSCSASRVER